MSVEVCRRGPRLHLRHGPIELSVICEASTREAAFASAINAMDGLLERLVEELGDLRRMDAPRAHGPVARRMWAAVQPWKPVPVTPMAAVAGAVADEVLAAMRDAGAGHAAVNNGGDIATCVGAGRSLTLAIAGLDGRAPARIRLTAADGIGGVATSGRGGRSLTRGIADTVTVLAASAAAADAAATLLANAVDLPGHPAITRARACDLDPGSDLGALSVVTGLGALTPAEIDRALARGSRAADKALISGVISGAALSLGGRMICLGRTHDLIEGPAHA